VQQLACCLEKAALLQNPNVVMLYKQTTFVQSHATQVYLINWPSHVWGRDSSVGIATGYGLDGSGMESRWGARFLAHVQTGRRAHPASCTMGTVSFPGVKRPGRDANHPPLLAPRSGKSKTIPLPPLLWAFGPVTGYLYLYLTCMLHVSTCI
jgi:hypothetical protein